MSYACDIFGTKGALRFDEEDRNALWHDDTGARRGREGFIGMLTGPRHPDYLAFCQGPGHGTGYQDRTIIEARDFLQAIETGRPVWPTFRDGLAANEVTEAARLSFDQRRWVGVDEVRRSSPEPAAN